MKGALFRNASLDRAAIVDARLQGARIIATSFDNARDLAEIQPRSSRDRDLVDSARAAARRVSGSRGDEDADADADEDADAEVSPPVTQDAARTTRR